MPVLAGSSSGLGDRTQEDQILDLELGPARTSAFATCIVDGLLEADHLSEGFIICSVVDHSRFGSGSQIGQPVHVGPERGSLPDFRPRWYTRGWDLRPNRFVYHNTGGLSTRPANCRAGFMSDAGW